MVAVHNDKHRLFLFFEVINKVHKRFVNVVNSLHRLAQTRQILGGKRVAVHLNVVAVVARNKIISVVLHTHRIQKQRFVNALLVFFYNLVRINTYPKCTFPF